MSRCSWAPMIHVKRVAGHAACRVRTTASVWQTSPMADSRSMQTDSGGFCWKFLRGDMPLVRIPTTTGAILYDPSRLHHPAAAEFDPVGLAAAGRVRATARGRGNTWFVSDPQGAGTWVLRHYRRGGLIARLARDLYLWRGDAATRAFRELELLAVIECMGLPAARPVGAYVQRVGPFYRADLLTVAVPGARTLSECLGSGLDGEAWDGVGRTIRSFHDAGIFHADLNAHNILLDDAGGVALIDFDRGAIRPPGRWRGSNLARLERSLRKVSAARPGAFGAPQWQALLAGYQDGRR